jgi:hypothetical protein
VGAAEEVEVVVDGEAAEVEEEDEGGEGTIWIWKKVRCRRKSVE